MALARMNLTDVKEQASGHAEQYYYLLDSGEWCLDHAHSVLKQNRLGLFETAGLVMAMACFQCEKPENVIKITEDVDMGEVKVCDVTGEISHTFEGGTSFQRRSAATQYADSVASRLGLRVISNY